MVYRWLSRGWLALGVFFVLLAILVSLVRVGGPLLNQHRQALLDTLLADSKLEASVDRIGLDWTQRGPALELQQLVIAPNSGRFALRLGKGHGFFPDGFQLPIAGAHRAFSNQAHLHPGQWGVFPGGRFQLDGDVLAFFRHPGGAQANIVC